MKSINIASVKAAIVLVPSYLAAYLTEQMVYVVPTLAAASFFASSIDMGEGSTRTRVDENDDAEDGEDGDLGLDTSPSDE